MEGFPGDIIMLGGGGGQVHKKTKVCCHLCKKKEKIRKHTCICSLVQEDTQKG